MQTSLCALLMVLCWLGSGCTQGLIVKGQEPWLAEHVPALIRFRPTQDTVALVVTRTGRDWVQYEAPDGGYSDKGFIKLDGAEWICFTSWSSDFNPSLPDLIVAIDDKGHLYACNGHLCAYLQLGGLTAGKPKKVTEFVRSRVAVGTGRPGTERWVQVDEWTTKFGSAPVKLSPP